ncbi:MAG: LamG domain-containing protein, partial [Verrucomicrobiae bacterium]|nr:LamG domain-containing protein [Verrucomicrobiae bacterium]
APHRLCTTGRRFTRPIRGRRKGPGGNPAKPPGAWNLNTTSIGGILRANPTHWLTGLIDDVALWNRALTQEEIAYLAKNVTPTPYSKPAPLVIRFFTADLPAVAVGDSVRLRWDVTKNAQVEIDQGIGDVTALTSAGIGSISVPITVSRTFTITIKRGTETASAQVSVAAIDGITPGWSLIDNFDRYSPGLLNGNRGWKDLDGTEMLLLNLNGNMMVAPSTGDAMAVLRLNDLALLEGQRKTLFFRLYHTGDPLESARAMVALTDRNLRFGNEGGTTGNDIGSGAIASNEVYPGWGLMLGAANGNGAPIDFFEPLLEQMTVYNVWVDIKNDPFPEDRTSTGDTYTIHVAKEGSLQRTTVLSDYVSARGQGSADLGFATKDLDKLIISALTGHSTTTNLFFDDIYISKNDFLSTVPRPFGFTVPVQPQPPTLTITSSASGISVSWTGGTLESATNVNGPWSPVPGATKSPYNTTPSEAARFFRAKQ